MDTNEIMTRLAGYRPELYDDDDPEIAEALRLARADPELSAWLDEAIAFDRQFAATLQEMPLQSGGIEAVLAAARTGNGPAASAHPMPRRRRSLRRWMTVAAVAVLLAAAVLGRLFVFPAPVSFPAVAAASGADFRDQMAYFANQRFVLDELDEDLGTLREWLADAGSPVYATTPDQVARYEGMGCKVIDWNGTPVSLVCFLNSEGDVVHLFVVGEDALPGGVGASLADLQRVRGLETSGWTAGGHVLLLVGSEPDVSIREVLQTT